MGVRIRGGLLTTTKNAEESKKRRETIIRILLKIREKEVISFFLVRKVKNRFLGGFEGL